MILFICLLGLASVSSAREICYGDLGCFTDEYPFSGSLSRPIAFLPESPERINVKFTLFNKNTAPEGEPISSSFVGDSFDPAKPTKMIVHGFLHNARKPWVIQMRSAIMNTTSDINLITVDWSRGNGFPYTQATANTQVVGAVIAQFVKTLAKERGANPADFHIIGHSLGSHIAGYAGKKLNGLLGKITGLDPAGPYFEYTDPRVQLSQSDALFVEVIHTDGTASLQLGLGLLQPSGHVDFYPNGGKNQPECPQTSGKILSAIFNIATVDLQGIEDNLGCSHMSAVFFYIDSIQNTCKYQAYQCSSEQEFNQGKCVSCGKNGCNRMGFWSDSSKDQGNLYVRTQSPNGDSFCKQSYSVIMKSSDVGFLQTSGKFTVYFETRSGETSSVEVLDDNTVTFKPGSIESRLVSINEPLNEQDIEAINVSFVKNGNWLTSWMYDSKWSFEYIDITSGEAQKTQRFCSQSGIVESQKTVRFNRC